MSPAAVNAARSDVARACRPAGVRRGLRIPDGMTAEFRHSVCAVRGYRLYSLLASALMVLVGLCSSLEWWLGFNLVPDLYRTESVAVVQLMVPDPDAVTRWPIAAQLALLDHFREVGATTIWFSHGKAGYRMVVPPSAAQSAATRAALEAVGGITRQ